MLNDRHSRALARWVAIAALALALVAGSAARAATQERSSVEREEAARFLVWRALEWAAGDSLPAVPVDTLMDLGARSSSLSLVLNIPAFRLDVFEGGEIGRSFTVAAGAPRHPTPLGSFEIGYVVWNPWWHPPDREWARGKRITPPGPNNPMGWVKINFRRLYYLHGTPEEGSLGGAASHGCVRMANEDVITLARIIHQHASPPEVAGGLDILVRNPARTRWLHLERRVPLQIVYRLAEVRDEHLEIYPDVYGRRAGRLREDVLQALSAAGYSRTAIDADRLEEVLAQRTRNQRRIPLESLLAAAAGQ